MRGRRSAACLVVDDGSTGTTSHVARSAGAEVVPSEGRGLGAAVRCGHAPPATAGHDATRLTVGDGRGDAVEEADVLVGDEHVHEAPQLALLVEEALGEPGCAP